ncbi:hypothetical protein SOVF_169660 [Spinacia oleracea]|nr:hypothetical protein SOVF_169660 [Spinacia oleracea]
MLLIWFTRPKMWVQRGGAIDRRFFVHNLQGAKITF